MNQTLKKCIILIVVITLILVIILLLFNSYVGTIKEAIQNTIKNGIRDIIDNLERGKSRGLTYVDDTISNIKGIMKRNFILSLVIGIIDFNMLKQESDSAMTAAIGAIHQLLNNIDHDQISTNITNTIHTILKYVMFTIYLFSFAPIAVDAVMIKIA